MGIRYFWRGIYGATVWSGTSSRIVVAARAFLGNTLFLSCLLLLLLIKLDGVGELDSCTQLSLCRYVRYVALEPRILPSIPSDTLPQTYRTVLGRTTSKDDRLWKRGADEGWRMYCLYPDPDPNSNQGGRLTTYLSQSTSSKDHRDLDTSSQPRNLDLDLDLDFSIPFHLSSPSPSLCIARLILFHFWVVVYVEFCPPLFNLNQYKNITRILNDSNRFCCVLHSCLLRNWFALLP